MNGPIEQDVGPRLGLEGPSLSPLKGSHCLEIRGSARRLLSNVSPSFSGSEKASDSPDGSMLTSLNVFNPGHVHLCPEQAVALVACREVNAARHGHVL